MKPVGNETPVFHGTGIAFCDSYHVLFGQSVIHAEIFFEKFVD